MTFQAIHYPALPDDTSRAAAALFGKGNFYLSLGDKLEALLDELIPLAVQPGSIWKKAPETSSQFALLNILQFIEELPNRKMVQALFSRVELKYALHLPLSSPEVEQKALCEFRRQLFADPTSQEIFQVLVERFFALNPAASTADQPTSAFNLLISNCTLSRFDEVVEAMHRALESLALTDPEWLRQVAKPYWYSRYTLKQPLPRLPFTSDQWRLRAHQIGRDIQYLLAQIEQSQNSRLAALPEIKKIRRIWENEFVTVSDQTTQAQEFRWEFTRCAVCMLASELKEARKI